MKIIENRKRNQNTRLLTLEFKEKILHTPTYFPAISSTDSKFPIPRLLKFFIRSSYPQLLISAYDYYHYLKLESKLKSGLTRYSKKHFLFIDSGGYEKYWTGDKKWTFDLYKKIIPKIKSDFYTSFDGEFVQKKKNKFYDVIINNGLIHPTSQYLPIFHAPEPKLLLKTISRFLERYPYAINLIAIRELECGITTSERAKTIFQIRKILDKIGGKQMLHVLGAGHPISIALYSYCGADSFDSTDWFRSTFDPKSNTLLDSSHIDIVTQSPASIRIQDPTLKLLVHNLDTYFIFMKKIQALIKNNKLLSFLHQNKIDKNIIEKIIN